MRDIIIIRVKPQLQHTSCCNGCITSRLACPWCTRVNWSIITLIIIQVYLMGYLINVTTTIQFSVSILVLHVRYISVNSCFIWTFNRVQLVSCGQTAFFRILGGKKRVWCNSNSCLLLSHPHIPGTLIE